MDESLGQVLQEAAFEIRELRRLNEVLSAKVSVMEIFAAALGLRHGEQVMKPDVVWKIDKALQDMEKKDKSEFVGRSE